MYIHIHTYSHIFRAGHRRGPAPRRSRGSARRPASVVMIIVITNITINNNNSNSNNNAKSNNSSNGLTETCVRVWSSVSSFCSSTRLMKASTRAVLGYIILYDVKQVVLDK